MNTLSASPAERPTPPTSASVRVWDVPVRVFHWLAVVCFAGAWVTAESESWRLLHVTLGYTLGGLVLFRLVWGLVGTRHARFASFVRGPGAVTRYLRSLVARRPEHHVGHNPAGAWAIVGLLALALTTVASGWASYESLGGEWLEELHEGAANAMLALVIAHVAGVIVSSWLHRENLVAGMVTGRKHGTPADAVRRAWTALGALMLAAVLGFWTWQWRTAPAGDAPGLTAASPLDAEQGRRHRAGHDDDDD